jgi:hypothetical protein
VTQAEALQIAIDVLIDRADLTGSTTEWRKLAKAIGVLRGIETLYDPASDAWAAQ